MSNEQNFPPGWNQEPNPPAGPPPGSGPAAPNPNWAPTPAGGGGWGPPPGGAAPGGFAPSGYPGSPYPQPAKRSGCRTALIILGILFVLALLSIGGCSWFLINATRPPVDATNNFYAALSDGRYQDAYDLMCPNSRPESVQVFEAQVSAPAATITGYNFTTVNTSNNLSSTVRGTVDLNGTSYQAVVELSNIDDAWKVCSFNQP
ncbi:MAG: hypothetical protein ACK5RL_04020 [Acidimicrobiales bacterium]